MSLRVSGEFWDQIKQTLVTDSFWQLPRYIIVILEAFLPKTRWRVDLFSFSWSCFWIWKPNIEQKVCFVFVAIVDRCIIVGLIVGSSRARQHTSSCVWNRARLFINNPPPIQGPGLTGGDKDGLSKIWGYLVQWRDECESHMMMLVK